MLNVDVSTTHIEKGWNMGRIFNLPIAPLMPLSIELLMTFHLIICPSTDTHKAESMWERGVGTFDESRKKLQKFRLQLIEVKFYRLTDNSNSTATTTLPWLWRGRENQSGKFPNFLNFHTFMREKSNSEIWLDSIRIFSNSNSAFVHSEKWKCWKYARVWLLILY